MGQNKIPLSARILLPAFRAELPGWGRLLKLFKFDGHSGDPRWDVAGEVTITGKLHGQQMRLDLSEWSQRYTYLLGRFYDLPTQLLISTCVRPGDCVADIGANIGMISLHAAVCVGPHGRVHAFEPNPAMCQRIREALDLNRIEQVEVHRVGLSDMPGELVLTVVSSLNGMATYGPIAERDESKVAARIPTPVLTGDVALGGVRSLSYIKVDVEGFEGKVLRGLAQTISLHRPVVSCEVADTHLMRSGTCREELFATMAQHGYRSFNLSTGRKGFNMRRLRLLEIQNSGKLASDDVAWIHPDSDGWERTKYCRV